MRHDEGMRITLADEGRLDASGILTCGECTTKAYGLPDESVQLLLLVAAAGDSGLPKSRVPKALQEALTVHLLPLELQNLVGWERDNRGRLAYLVLTWKGEEAIAAARSSSSPKKSMAERRRRALAS